MGLEIGFALIASAFIAGVLSFLAPCTFPIVPAYLGFISGVRPEDLEDKEKAGLAKRKIVLNGVAFIVGFAIVFIALGSLIGFVGGALLFNVTIWASRIGGALIILFGLMMLGVFKLSFLQSDKKIKMPKWLNVGKPSSSMIIGSIFAFGWTPCVGPVLGAILTLSATSGTAGQGAFLLAVFSLGLAIPFIVVAVAFSRATSFIEKNSKYLKAMSVIGGVFLIFLGILVMTDSFGILIDYGYRWFDFLNYERLMDFL